MYVHHGLSSVVQPTIALHGFKRVHLEPGASTTVSFDVGPEQLAILDTAMRRSVEPGPVDILVGSSSAETSSVRLTIVE
jgi:beta-glucosidase